ncbi:MAG: hypothetical protein KatS3mg111_3680 [Pirellulaceae bacterium]|nr:MAG: hypothetical protein KatS3mg111_3680 [Pirellulaceae bacterium]
MVVEAGRVRTERAGARESQYHTLWVDGVGGFQLCEDAEVLIGHALPGAVAGVQIEGDLPRVVGALRRADDRFLLQPLQPVALDGRMVDRPVLLPSRAVMQIGRRITLQFSQPSPLCTSARLELLSHHRFGNHVDAVLLVGNTCLLGPGEHCHVRCPAWTDEILLYRSEQGWMMRSKAPLWADGQWQPAGSFPLRSRMRLVGETWSMTWSPRA